MSTFAYELGSTAIDTITGFVGTIVGRSEWTTGCRTYYLCPEVAEDGAYRESQWFDEDRIGVVSHEVDASIEKPHRESIGGPIPQSMPTK